MERDNIQPMVMQGNLAENWKLWVQKFNNYLIATEASGKDDKIQCAKLLHTLRDEAITIYNTFTFTGVEKDNLAQLIQKFENYFVLKKSLAFERYKFFTLRQEAKSIEQFAIEIRNQAKKCEFAQLENDLVKTILTIGIKSDSLKEKLLQIETLSLDKAIELCVISENTKSQTKKISSRGKIE